MLMIDRVFPLCYIGRRTLTFLSGGVMKENGKGSKVKQADWLKSVCKVINGSLDRSVLESPSRTFVQEVAKCAGKSDYEKYKYVANVPGLHTAIMLLTARGIVERVEEGGNEYNFRFVRRISDEESEILLGEMKSGRAQAKTASKDPGKNSGSILELVGEVVLELARKEKERGARISAVESAVAELRVEKPAVSERSEKLRARLLEELQLLRSTAPHPEKQYRARSAL